MLCVDCSSNKASHWTPADSLRHKPPLAVPMMMGATVLDLYKSMGFLTMQDFPMFAVGFITAFIVALLAIKVFLELIKRISFVSFAIYRFIVAAAVYAVFM